MPMHEKALLYQKSQEKIDNLNNNSSWFSNNKNEICTLNKNANLINKCNANQIKKSFLLSESLNDIHYLAWSAVSLESSKHLHSLKEMESNECAILL